MLKFKEFLKEGNPLARMYKHEQEGRHHIAISAARPGQSKKQRKEAMNKLKKHFRDHGYGFRKAEGHYEGEKEPSIVVHAKTPGNKSASELVRVARAAGERFDQDSVLHHTGKTARLIGTNKTGYPGYGKSEKVGTRLKYNNKESPFQTELRPNGKHQKGHEARYTT